jgi:NADH-quinone oxidoreductase subunit C
MSEPTADDAAEEVVEPPTLHGCPVTESRGQTVVHSSREEYLGLMKALVDDGYQLCVDVTAVDYLTHPGRALPPGVEPERFEVVVGLLDIDTPRRVRVRVQVPADDATLPTLFDVWPGTEALEREVFDMFGIRFEGHPDLSRILMPEDWIGHPLRKDYDVGDIPVQFKEAERRPPQSRQEASS